MGNPTCHQWKQRKLIGEGYDERKEILNRANSLVSDLLADKPDGVDAATHHQTLRQTGKLTEKLKEKENIILEASLKDISKEKKRIGGNWAVAGIDLMRKYQREYAKYFL